jgi:hypothetical protein
MLKSLALRTLLGVMTFAHAPIASAYSASANKIGPQEIQTAANSPRWRKILLYRDHWRTNGESIVDDPEFFLNPDGATNPDVEMENTLRVFSEGTPAERQEALCRFPARRKFLETKFQIIFSDTDPKNESEICKRYREFLEVMRSNSVSLVFSSINAMNPHSLFGNTFLKFKNNKPVGDNGEPGPVFIVSHSARTDQSNPIFYPYNVVAGNYPGMLKWFPAEKFSGELVNSEMREQWEYELNFNSDEVSYILATVFELSNRRVDYFLLDENGSYMMLALLDVGRPALNLVKKFARFFIAGDTVRAVVNTPNLLNKVQYHPSALDKYVAMEQDLGKKERNAYKELLAQNEFVTKKALGSKINFETVSELTPPEQARVLDTALGFLNTRGQNLTKQQLARLKRDLETVAQKRAELGVATEFPELPVPDATAPHFAFPASRIGLGVTNPFNSKDEGQPTALISWRPALQTLESSLRGMPDGLGLGFLNLEVMANKKGVSLREFSLVSMDFLPAPKADETFTTNWSMDIGYRQQCFQACKQSYLAAQYGLTWKLERVAGRTAVRGGLKLGDDQSSALFVEPGITGLLSLELVPQNRWTNSLTLSRQMSLWKGPEWHATGSSTWAWRPAEPWELQGSVELRNAEIQILARSFYYF